MDVTKEIREGSQEAPEPGFLEKGAGSGGTGAAEPELTGSEFEKLLDMYDVSFRNLAEGHVVRGRVIRIHANEVIVDVGYKSEGLIDIAEFRDGEGNVRVAVGDEVDVLLERTEDKDGYIVLSKMKAEKIKVWDLVERAYRTGEVITGRVVDRIKGGLAVDIGVRAFLPGSLVDLRPVRNLDSLRGKEFEMRVIKVNRRRGNIVLSRKAVLEVVNRELKKKTLDLLGEGKMLRGTVKNLTEYGAFIDLGGIDGLLHVTDMSWGRVNHPSEMFKVGEEVETVVLKFDRERERVSLGYKQLQADPWTRVVDRFPVGSRVRGRVVSLTDYGAFVELEPGVEGLIHVSEMSWTKRIKHPSKVLSVGDQVEVAILEVDRDGRRLSLGLKQTEPNPWDVIAETYAVGSRIRGQVRNLTDFGAFIEVEEGVDGLVHISDLSWTRTVKHPSEVLAKGESVEAVVLKIDSENHRLSLGIKQLTPNPWDTFFASHETGEVLQGQVTRVTDFGAFVELAEGVEGLVHVSELGEERGRSAKDQLSPGCGVTVKILRMDPLEKRIGLSVKAVREDTEQRDVQDFHESAGSTRTLQIGDIVDRELLTRSRRAAPGEEEGEESGAEPGEDPNPRET
ncbi:MAG: 30S ribosomal protein S1 [Acidobacteria bacterium]|nr:30S ribosomal protein S1 [Acidobacteriota bacterium]